MAYRLMTLEAMNRNAWPQAGLAARLKKHHGEIPRLSAYQQAIAGIPLLGIQVLPITYSAVEAATLLSQHH